ncbi:MAG TPA: nucleoside hydrolase [Acidimicrobiales bacterium]
MRLLVDTDTGIDDALALLWLAGRSDVDLVAVHATHGNCVTGQAAANARYVLDVAGRDDVPVIAGRPGPLSGPPRPRSGVHGRDGLGDRGLAPSPWPPAPPGEDAVADLLRRVEAQAGELDLLALGPLTNLGAALRSEPGLLGAFRSLTIMGGTGLGTVGTGADPGPTGVADRTGAEPGVAGIDDGAAPPAAPPPRDTNTVHDPEAARLVAAATGTPVTMVGLDVTLATATATATAKAGHLTHLATATRPSGRLASTIARAYVEASEVRRGTRRLPLHDPLGAMVCVGADIGAAFAWGRAAVVGPPGEERTIVTADAAGGSAPGAPSAGRRTRALTAADAHAVADQLVGALADAPRAGRR